MERDKKELALHVIKLKIAKEMKENEERDFKKLQEKIKKLEEEKKEIYRDNEEVVEKVLNEYLKEVK